MSWGLIYYLVTLASSISGTAEFFCFISFLVSFASTIILLVSTPDSDENTLLYNRIFSLRKYSLWVFGMSMILSSFIPNKRDAVIILGLHTADKSIGEEVESLPPKLMKLLNKELDSLIGEDKKE